MKSQFFAAAVAAAVFGVGTLRADVSTNEIPEAGSDIELPTVEAAVGYRTAKIEYGMVENDEGVFATRITTTGALSATAGRSARCISARNSRSKSVRT